MRTGTKREAVSVDEKLELLDYLERCDSMQQTMATFYSNLTGKKYENRRVQIYSWRSSRESLIAASKKSRGGKRKKNRPPGAGRRLSDALELKIVAWVNLVPGEGVPISSELFHCWYAEEVAKEAEVAKFKASRHWQKRFLKRHRLSMRSKTRQGQIRPENAQEQAAKFAEAWDRVAQRTIEAGYRRTGIVVDASDVIEALGDQLVDRAIGEMTEDAEFDN